jgi:hypothetical protein
MGWKVVWYWLHCWSARSLALAASVCCCAATSCPVWSWFWMYGEEVVLLPAESKLVVRRLLGSCSALFSLALAMPE